MPNFPIAPHNAPLGDNNPPGNALVLHNPSSGLASRRVEDLDPPKSAYPSVPLDATLYPERGVYGLGIRHVRPFAQWTFERWFNFNYDFYALYLNDLVNAVAADIALEDRDRYDLFVPEEFIPEGDVQIYGRVVRAGSGQESTSPLQTILIKTTRPGGRDNDPGSKWHPGLVMTVEGLPEGSTVNIDNANSGVWCLIQRYENLRQNDQIELSWDGVLVTHIVSPAEVAGSGPIRVFVSRDIILQGGHFGKLTLRFRVSDVVQNFSGDKYQYSKPYFLDSELDPNLLFAPIFLVDGEEATQIDFDTQSEATFEVLVTVPRQTPAPLPRHQLAVTLFGTLGDGSTQVFPLAPVVDRNLSVEFVTVDREIIEQLVGGSFRVSFQWLKNDGRVEQSGSTSVSVVGTPVAMPAVTVAPIEVGLIEPDQDITVQIPFYEPHNPDWLETLVIEHIRPGGGGEDYEEEQLAGAQGGTRYVSKEHLKQFEGVGDIAFYYLVNDGAGHVLDGNALTTRKSRELFAHVGERIGNMPTAHLEGALGNNIDPSHVTTPTLLLTLPLTLPAPHGQTEEGDLIHWNAIGSGLDGSASGVVRINGGTAGKPLVFPVSRAILDNNNNGSLRITYSLERSGPPRLVLRSEVLNLTVGRGVQLDRPVIDGATLFPDALNPLAALSGAKVIVRYRPMQATDQIKVDWLSRDGLGSATEYTLGNPSTNEVFVTIPARTIARGIRPGGNQISVQYHFNRGAFPYPSDTVDLHLLPLTGLPTPTIDGIGDSTLLDLSKLNDQARARVSVWPFIDAGQFMWMSWEGTFADGSPYREDTYTANLVTENGAANGISPPAPVDKLQRLMDGSHLTIRFWVSLAESPDKNTAVLFGVREHRVQTLPAVLPHPRFNDQPGATLTIQPLDHVDNASVTVAYGGMNPSHSIQLQWIFPDGGVADIGAKDGLDGGRVDFVITNEVLADSVGKTIELRYVATINGSPVPSETQVLTVARIPAGRPPQPRINNMNSGTTLDLQAFTGDAHASVAKWELSKQGQRVWITLEAAGVEPLSVLRAHAITAAQAANGITNQAVSRSWLASLGKNTTFTVTCKVTYDGSDDESKAIPLLQSTYTVTWLAEVKFIPTLLHSSNGVVVSPDGRRVYVAVGGGGRTAIYVIDTATDAIIHSASYDIQSSGHLAIHPDGSRLYLDLVRTGIAVISTTSFARVATYATVNEIIVDLAINTAGTRLYITVRSGAYTYDAATGNRIAQIAGQSYFIARSPNNTRAYLTTYGGGFNPIDTTVINTANNSVVTVIQGVIGPMALSTNTPRLYLARADGLGIINTNTNSLVTVIGAGSGRSVAVNPVLPHAYTAGFGAFNIFDTNTDRLIATVPADIGFGSGNIAVLPNGSKAYFTSSDSQGLYVMRY